MAGRKVFSKAAARKDGEGVLTESKDGHRILCVSDARGALFQLNALAKKHRAHAIVHTGNFGFFDGDSADSMAKDVLAAAANASPVVKGEHFHHMNEEHLRESVGSQLSELPLFLAGAQKFNVPVYTIWGNAEDIAVIEKFRDGTYSVPNLHLVDDLNAPVIPQTSIRLLGLPGHFKKSWFFDIADGVSVPGRAGATWVGIWQVQALMKTFMDTYDPNETRLFLSHTSTASKPLLNYISMLTRAQFTLSASTRAHTSSFSDAAVYGKPERFRRDIANNKFALAKLWSQIKAKVFDLTEDNLAQRTNLSSAVNLLSQRSDDMSLIEQAFEHKWNYSLGGGLKGGVLLTLNEKAGQIFVRELGTSFALCTMGGVDAAATAAAGTGSGSKDESAAAKSEMTDDDDSPSEASKASKKAKSRKDHTNGSFKDTASESSSSSSDGGASAEGDSPKPEDLDKAALKAAARKEKAKRQKEKKKQLPKEKKPQPTRPGLWFKNGDRSPEEILGFLAEQDRSANPKVEFSSIVKPNGLKSKVALVVFDSPEQASGAYDRVNKDAAGTVSIYQPEQHRVRKPFAKGQKL